MTAVPLGGIFTTTNSRAALAACAVADCARAKELAQDRPKLVFDLNAHGLATYYTNPQFKRALDQADIIHADGGFLVFLSRLLCGAAITERAATTDMIHDIAQRFERTGQSFFLLGGTVSSVQETAVALGRAYPKLNIAGVHHGYFGIEQEATVVTQINACDPDVVWVGLGKPKEQEFALRQAPHLKCGWVVTCGGCFNYITGAYRRAPRWMQSAGLEWLHRLFGNPRRLFWRYLWTIPFALYLVFRHASKQVIND